MVQEGSPASETGTDSKWWLELPQGAGSLADIHCEACGGSHRAFEAFCLSSGSFLVEHWLGRSNLGRVKNGLRVLALLVAISVGYLGLRLAPFMYALILLALLISVFLRHWPMGRRYANALLGVGALFSLIVAPTPFSPVALPTVVALVAVLVIGLPLFAALATHAQPLPVERSPSGQPTRSELTWLTTLICTMMVPVLGFGLGWLLPERLGHPLRSLSQSGMVSLVFATAAFAVICGSIRSLRGSAEPSAATNPRWRFRCPIELLKLPRVPQPNRVDAQSWVDGFVDAWTRFAVLVFNHLIDVVEAAHRLAVRSPAAWLTGTAERLLNGLWRIGTLVIRHVLGTLAFAVEFVFLGLRVAKDVVAAYFRTFVAVPLLLMAAGWTANAVGENVASYMQSGQVMMLPGIVLNAPVALVLTGTGVALLLRIRLVTLLPHYSTSVLHFSSDAYILFLLTSWPLGVAGHLGHGPFRIGPLTLLGTVGLLPFGFLVLKRLDVSVKPGPEMPGERTHGSLSDDGDRGAGPTVNQGAAQGR